MTQETAASQASLYDEAADSYHHFAPQSPTWLHVEAPTFDELAQEYYDKSMATLDIGCGTGRLTQHLIHRGIPRERVTGVDQSSKMLNYAQAALPSVAFVQQSLLKLDLPQREYQLVTANMVFESLDNTDLYVVYDRVYRHLARGGRFVFVVTHPLRHAHDQAMHKERGWHYVTAPWGQRLRDFNRPKGDFISMLVQTGFEVEQVLDCHFPASHLERGKLARYAPCAAVRLAVRARK